MHPDNFLSMFLILLLDERGYPKNSDSTDDGSTKLTQNATPGDTQQREQPSAEGTAKETKHQVHHEAEAATFH